MTQVNYKRIAVIDIGKTNAKLVVLDAASGHDVAVRRMPNKVLSGAPYPHYDIDALWQFFAGALKELAVDPGFDAISITTHGASAVLLDAEGEFAFPVLDYEFEYPDDIRSAYDAIRPDFSETCSPRLVCGLNVGAQLHYLKAAFPEDFARVATILTYPQYWAYRLTGVLANEATSLGCHTDLWQPATGEYSVLVERLGIGGLMAPVRSAFDALGHVLPELRDELGIVEDIPVYCGIHDSNASLLPHLITHEAPFAVVSTGTWVVSFAIGATAEGLDPTRDTLANVNAHGNATPSSRFMGGREFEILVGAFPEPVEAEAHAAAEDVIRRGIMLLPSVVQGSGPYPAREMCWIGEPQGVAEQYAAASLYEALMTMTALDLIRADGPILVEGPFARNPVYMRALASISGRPVLSPGEGSSTGTAQGAALLTGITPWHQPPHAVAGVYEIAPYVRAWKLALAG